jgi:hypothetical protein
VRGFLTEYSEASLEEDVNMMAAGMLSGRKEFWRAVDGSARVKKKFRILVDFYRRIDASFSEESVRKIAYPREASARPKPAN